MTDKTYNCPQAKIIAEQGNHEQACIMEAGNDFTEELMELRGRLKAKYWALHKVPSNIDSAAKLGQLAIAVKKVEEAYSAINAVRCW